MIRLQENVPQVYVEQSRDFQLFCRLFDLTNCATRFSIESAYNLLNPLLACDRILPLLATRVGFFPKHDYNSRELRFIVTAFPYLLKYKGSKKGIEMALYAVLKAEGQYKQSIVDIDQMVEEDTEKGNINIYTEDWLVNQSLLEDVLSYILPIGYQLNIGIYKSVVSDDGATSQIAAGVTNESIRVLPIVTSKVISSNELNSLAIVSNVLTNAIGNYNSMEVLSAENISKIIVPKNHTITRISNESISEEQ